MPNTYVKLQTITTTTAVNAVTFSSIPQTYTDLKLCVSARATSNSANQGFYFQLSGTGGTFYSQTVLRADGSSASTFRGSNSNAVTTNEIPNELNTVGLFSNTEIYIPNYTTSQTKQILIDGVKENNSASTAIQLYTKAALWTNAGAVTSLAVGTDISAPNYFGGSTFTLYGIKNTF
jgi:hypothetical protein